MKKELRTDKERLRDLARQTLEAYRSLNTVAAEASFGRNGGAKSEGLSRAGELLESVVSEIKGTSKPVN